MFSSSVASSVSASGGSASPTGTGSASLGDRSADPVALEAESSCRHVCNGCLAVARSLHKGTSMQPQLQKGREQESLSQRRVKGTTRVSSFSPGSTRHSEASVLSNFFVHFHHEQRVVFSSFFFGSVAAAPFHFRGREALSLHGYNQVGQNLHWKTDKEVIGG